METVYYEIKAPRSVPMYDEIKDSYHMLIDDEMVEIPAKLFNKLFTKSDAKNVKLDSEQNIVKSVLERMDINTDSNYKEYKDLIKFLKKTGITKPLYKMSLEVIFQNDSRELINKHIAITDKIFDELEKEDLNNIK